ncbi:uncharacterized protein K02A2.6-like [Anopheles stephensi]|uniref:uncharacterized protein K02A2.6-like n=1 Tax=Anopheles stephensi TaxID=30069 RepID=UPI0016589E06|nr:uncharacterized protein K02A2.6-like [Anopheles stephensi]
MYYLLVIDTFTKWPEIVATTTMTAKTTIRILREIFSRFGMPNVLVSDNGTQFTSTEFELFCTINGIEHLRTAPFHPQSNGQAERFVDTFKRALRKMEGEGGSVQEAVDIFLMTYRSTPHKLLERNQSPAELMLGRRLRTCMELLRPTMNVSSGVKVGEPLRKYERNDLVYAKQYYRNKWKWVAGTVRKRLGSVMYEIVTEENRFLRSHINQMRSRVCDERRQGRSHIPDGSKSYQMLDVLLDAWDITLNGTIESRQENAESNIEIARSRDRESSSSASFPTSSSSSPLLLSSTVQSDSPTSSSSEEVRSATSPGFATADSGSSTPVQPLRRSTRIRRSPQWMEPYRRY